jgi:hypothetical protein
MYRYLLVFALVSASAQAQVGVFVTYEQWEQLPNDLRTAYITGAFDSMLVYAADQRAQSISLHFHNCVRGHEIDGSKLSDNVRAFVQAHPQSQLSVQQALLNYLVQLCGKISDHDLK